MSKCFIPEISIRTIRSDENMSKLKNNFEYEENTKNIICTCDGFYEISDNSIVKYVTIQKDTKIFENFIDKYTLLVDSSYDKKIGFVDFIPYESQEMVISMLIFNMMDLYNSTYYDLIYLVPAISIIIFKHSENISRLINNNENKLSFSKK